MPTTVIANFCAHCEERRALGHPFRVVAKINSQTGLHVFSASLLIIFYYFSRVCVCFSICEEFPFPDFCCWPPVCARSTRVDRFIRKFSQLESYKHFKLVKIIEKLNFSSLKKNRIWNDPLYGHRHHLYHLNFEEC